MLSYTGNSAYCYTHSLSMSLLGAGATFSEIPEPGFLECLTTMPFGNMYLALEDGPLAFFSGPTVDPDAGLTRALATLGWTCEVQRGGDDNEALTRLRKATEQAPVLVGPLDMGFLSYHPQHAFQKGADHFMVALVVENEHVVLHDPQGYPCAILPHDEFLQAWRAEDIPYRQAPYTFRSTFQQVERVNRQEMIARTLPVLHDNLTIDPEGPIIYGGPRVFSLLAKDLREKVPESLAGHLLHFALPLAARRTLDAASFMREAKCEDAAVILTQQAHLFGIAQYKGTHGQWARVAENMEQIGELEMKLVSIL
jgi:hypothetical protein